ncbi:MAG: choice-of-anchor Q domain-containing protein [Verrucomicrobiia bacterium]
MDNKTFWAICAVIFLNFNLQSATLTVFNNADNGAGSLRNTIAVAAPGDDIIFINTLNDQTITLTSGQIVIDKTLTINGLGATNLTISGNTNGRIFSIPFDTTNVISNLKLTRGLALSASGGAIRHLNGVLTVSNVIFATNFAEQFGGGIANLLNGTLNVMGCTFVNNAAQGNGGGAIHNDNARVFVSNSTFIENAGDAGGGGGGAGCIFHLGTGGIEMQSSTLVSNLAGMGGAGGILKSGGGAVNIGHTIVIDNATDDMLTPDISDPAINSLGFNLIGVTNGAVGFVASDLINVTNAFLRPLADNGGPTPTLLPKLESPAINAGTNTALFNTDQRGLPRLIGGTMDIGAVETDYAVIALPGTTPQSAQTNTAYFNDPSVRVTEAGRNMSGIDIAFSAPNSGPSGTFPGGLLNINAVTDPNGLADSGVFTANDIVGAFSVTAAINNLSPVIFSLTNTELPVIPPAPDFYNSGDFADDGSTDVLAFRKKTLTLLNIVSNQLANQTTLDAPGKSKVVAANRVGSANYVAFKTGKKITVSAYNSSSNIIKVSDIVVGTMLPKTAGKIRASGDFNHDNIVDLVSSKKQKVFALTGPTFANPTEIPIPLTGNKLPGKIVGAFTTNGVNWVLVFQKGKSVPTAFQVALTTNGVVVVPGPVVTALSKVFGMSGTSPIIKNKKEILFSVFSINTKTNKVGKPVGPK